MDDDFLTSNIVSLPQTRVLTRGSQLPYKVPKDPAALGWSPTLPLEIAMRERTPKDICKAYGIDHETWTQLRSDPSFRMAVREADEALKREGARFKLKAQIQAEELLKTSFHMIHDPATPSAVQADLLKFTIRAAGLDGSKDQAGAVAGQAMGLILNINLA